MSRLPESRLTKKMGNEGKEERNIQEELGKVKY